MTFWKKTALTAATLGLVMAPVAATANTRAGDGSASYSTATAGPGEGRSAEGEKLEGSSLIFLAILSALGTAGVIWIIDGDEEQGPDGEPPADPPPNQSPGAN